MKANAGRAFALGRRGFKAFDLVVHPVPPPLVPLAGIKSFFENVRGIGADRRVEDEALSDLTRFREIETIDLRNAAIGDEGLRCLSGCKTMRVLHGGPSISNAGLAYLKDVPKPSFDRAARDDGDGRRIEPPRGNTKPNRRRVSR